MTALLIVIPLVIVGIVGTVLLVRDVNPPMPPDANYIPNDGIDTLPLWQNALEECGPETEDLRTQMVHVNRDAPIGHSDGPYNATVMWSPEKGWHDGGERVQLFRDQASKIHRTQYGDEVLTPSFWTAREVHHPYHVAPTILETPEGQKYAHLEDHNGPNVIPSRVTAGWQWVKSVDMETGWPMYVHERCPGPTCAIVADDGEGQHQTWTAAVTERDARLDAIHGRPWEGYVNPA